MRECALLDTLRWAEFLDIVAAACQIIPVEGLLRQKLVLFFGGHGGRSDGTRGVKSARVAVDNVNTIARALRQRRLDQRCQGPQREDRIVQWTPDCGEASRWRSNYGDSSSCSVCAMNWARAHDGTHR